jgi:hypothetical protein
MLKQERSRMEWIVNGEQGQGSVILEGGRGSHATPPPPIPHHLPSSLHYPTKPLSPSFSRSITLTFSVAVYS